MKKYSWVSYIIMIFIIGLLSNCSLSAGRDDNASESTASSGAQSINPVKPYIDYPTASIKTGYYYVKNRWTGEYLNLQHNDEYLERGPGPIDKSYLWYLESFGNGRYLFNNVQKDLRIFPERTWKTTRFYDMQNIYRWSDDPYIVNSTFQTGPFTITGGIPADRYVMCCEYLTFLHGYNIPDMVINPNAGWWSKDWYVIPESLKIIVDRFENPKTNELKYGRYIYQCVGSVALPNNPENMMIDSRAAGKSIFDGGYISARLEYRNVPGGIAGFGINLSENGSHPADLSPAKGIRFWARSDYGYSDESAPRAQVQINSANIGNYGWLGNYYHHGFSMSQDWRRFELPFSAFARPVYDDVPLEVCLRQIKSVEFQQDIGDNASGKNLNGNIYIDAVELYY